MGLSRLWVRVGFLVLHYLMQDLEPHLEISVGNGTGPVLSFAGVGPMQVCKIGAIQDSVYPQCLQKEKKYGFIFVILNM